MGATAFRPAAGLIDDAQPRVVFADLVAGALDRTGVEPSPLAAAYLVDLLAKSLRPEPPPAGADGGEETLAEAFLAARGLAGPARAARLRSLGDRALFRAGFFVDSLAPRTADAAWVSDAGRMAYAELACLLVRRPAQWQRSRLFEELADCFSEFAEVLTEVGDGTRPLVRAPLCERYLRLGRDAERCRLLRRGLVVPEAGPELPQ